MKISDYTIISGMAIDELIEKVEPLIAGGWQPFGNMVTEKKNRSYYYHQPMVKYASVLA